jgi:hypothetical protein
LTISMDDQPMSTAACGGSIINDVSQQLHLKEPRLTASKGLSGINDL